MSNDPAPYRPRCMNLTCKSMMIYGESFESDPEYQAGLTEFWCTLTSRNLGPDGEDATLDACSNAERACFQAF